MRLTNAVELLLKSASRGVTYQLMASQLVTVYLLRRRSHISRKVFLLESRKEDKQLNKEIYGFNPFSLRVCKRTLVLTKPCVRCYH